MRLTDLEFFLVELPASGSAVRTLLVHLTSESGLEGWGETRPLWNPGQLSAWRTSLLAVLAGRSIYDLESILAVDTLADPALACGIEMALCDLIGQAAGQPLCNLWGGAYRNRIPPAIPLWAGNVEQIIHWARTFAAGGIHTQTISASGNLEADLQIVAALSDANLPRVRFRLDTRGNYSAPLAAKLCGELQPGSVEYVIDPTSNDALAWLPRVQASSQVPLACYSAISSSADLFHLARGGQFQLAVIDPVRVGGLSRSRACAAVAQAAGLPAELRLHGTSGLALAATLQVAAATPAFGGAHQCTHPLLHDDLLCEPLGVAEGMLCVPQSPGLGVDVDRDKVDWYQVT